MLDSAGFDLWADDYDKYVNISDDNGTYPFAGYKDILNEIYNRVLASSAKNVLDVGFGTGILACRLYQQGCTVYGQDFSSRMVELAHEKMPKAKLYQGDFTYGLAEPLRKIRYDAIVATYSLHHLSDESKVALLKSLTDNLNENGVIYVGDVAFETREQLRSCREQAGKDWDEEEIYFVYDELREALPGLTFEKYSFCAGILTLTL